MDPHEHTHTVFIEVTFGLNTVFSGYTEFNRFVTGAVNKKIEALVARAQAIETTSSGENAERLQELIRWLERIRDTHIELQRSFYLPIVLWAIISALIGLAALYFDWIEPIGWYCGFLALPTLIYLLLVVLNYAVFWFRGTGRLFMLQGFHRMFDRPRQPPQPPSGNG